MHRDIYLPILADIRRYQSDSCSDIGLSSRHLGNTASLIHLAVSHQRLPWSKGRTMSPGIRMRARVVHADDERSERVSSASSVASRRIATPYGAEDLALGKVDSKTSKRKQLKFSARYTRRRCCPRHPRRAPCKDLRPWRACGRRQRREICRRFVCKLLHKNYTMGPPCAVAARGPAESEISALPHCASN